MKVCPNCGEAVQDTAKFCGNCAAPMADVPTVTEVSAVADAVTETPAVPAVEESVAPVEAPAAPTATEAPVGEPAVSVATEIPAPTPVPTPAASAVTKKSNAGKGVLIGVGGVLGVGVIAAAIGIGASVLGGGKNENVYYYKDGELVASTLGKEPAHWDMTDRLSQNALSNYEISYLSYSILLSDDGDTLFYPDRMDTDSDLYTLYYRDANDSEAEAVKVDSDVAYYAIDKKAATVYYVKGDGENATLYRKTLKDDAKVKIASGVQSYFFSNEDLSRVIYVVEESVERTDEYDETYQDYTQAIYQILDGGEPERIERGVDTLEYINTALTKMYFIKEGSLYCKDGDTEKVKIASDVYSVAKIYESGEIYFVRDSGEVTLNAYVDDDLAASDAAMQEPVFPDRPVYPDAPEYVSWFDYENDDEYQAAYEQYEKDYAAYEAECDRLYDEYEAACDKYYDDYDLYYEKLSRDNIRESLEDYTISLGYTVCYYNGTEITELTTTASSYYYSDALCQDDAKILFETYASGDFKKVKLSEMGEDASVYSLASEVKEALFGTTVYYMADGGSAIALDVDFDEDGIEDLIMDENGGYVYYYLNANDACTEADLYRAPIVDGTLGSEELYDTEVHTAQLYFHDGHVVYFKDIPESDYGLKDYGDLYIDKQLVDYDVYCGDYDDVVTYDTDAEAWYYLADYEEDHNYGVLKTYDGKESKTIGSDVVEYLLDDQDRLFYINDYSNTYECGTLYYYNGKDSVKVDEDVAAVIPVMQGTSIVMELLRSSF